MKKAAYIFTVVLLLVAGLGCRRDCDKLRAGFYIPLTAETEAWMGDSALQAFSMMDADSTRIPWQPSGGGQISWYECEGKPLKRYDIHEFRFTYSAPSTGETFVIALHSKEGVEAVLLTFNDLEISYDPHTGGFYPTVTEEGEIRPAGEILPSYALRGKVWQDVLAIDSRSTFVTYPKIWLAKGWGIIRYENQAGKAWERLP